MSCKMWSMNDAGLSMEQRLIVFCSSPCNQPHHPLKLYVSARSWCQNGSVVIFRKLQAISKIFHCLVLRLHHAFVTRMPTKTQINMNRKSCIMCTAEDVNSAIWKIRRFQKWSRVTDVRHNCKLGSIMHLLIPTWNMFWFRLKLTMIQKKFTF